MTPAMQPAELFLVFVTAEVPTSAASFVDWLTIPQKYLESQAGGVLLDLFRQSFFCAFVGAARLDQLRICEPVGSMDHIRRSLIRMATP